LTTRVPAHGYGPRSGNAANTVSVLQPSPARRTWGPHGHRQPEGSCRHTRHDSVNMCGRPKPLVLASLRAMVLPHAQLCPAGGRLATWLGILTLARGALACGPPLGGSGSAARLADPVRIQSFPGLPANFPDRVTMPMPALLSVLLARCLRLAERAGGHTLRWCPTCGASVRFTSMTGPREHAITCGTPTPIPRRGTHGWLRHRRIIPGKLSPEYPAI